MLENSIGCEEPTQYMRRLQKGGRVDHLNLYWSWHQMLNFGDWIGPYLFKKITGIAPLHCRVWRVNPPASLYFTAGSIFRKIKKDDVAIVWGSGTMDTTTTPRRPKRTLALRGPISQSVFDRLGYDVPDVVGDPGLCLPLFYKPENLQKSARLGIVAHGFDLSDWQNVNLPDGVKLISVNRDVEEVVQDIISCEAIASSSLHGIIEAHAYGVPACWIAPLRNELIGDGTKFRDYFLSVGMGIHKPETLEQHNGKDLIDLVHRCTLPTKSLANMAKELISVCPFNKEMAEKENQQIRK